MFMPWSQGDHISKVSLYLRPVDLFQLALTGYHLVGYDILISFITDHVTPALNHSSAIDSNLSSVISVGKKLEFFALIKVYYCHI